MAGLPTRSDPAINSSDALDENVISLSQGTTAQNWNGVYLADTGDSVGNSSSVVAPGDPAPGFTTVNGVPGYPAIGEPGGNPSLVTVPETDGNGASGANIISVGAPAGTAGGGSYYPNQSGADAVQNPMIYPGWTAQGNADEDTSALDVVVLPEYTAAHDTTVSDLFTPTISGGDSSYTVTTVEVDGVTTATLPTGFTLTASSGKIALTTSTVAGTYTLGFRVEDGSTPVNYATYEVTVVLT